MGRRGEKGGGKEKIGKEKKRTAVSGRDGRWI